jgi:hypothetical protein
MIVTSAGPAHRDAARRRARARFGVTVRMDPKVGRADGSIVEVPYVVSAAEPARRAGHAFADRVIADLIDEPLNHLPSSEFDAWPQLARTAQH